MNKLFLTSKTQTATLPSTTYRLPSTKPGFTIVELLVVIVVIGILAAITIVSYTGISQKAIVASIQSDLSGASNRLKMYYVENGQYPQGVNYTTGCPTTPVDDEYCLKSSSGNTFSNYSSTTPYQSFTLDATNTNTTKYRITNDSAPIAVTSTPGPATQGPLSPGTMADDATVGTVAWSNPNNAQVSDGVYATNPGGSSGNAISHYLKATNFGSSIPTGATINGIVVEFQKMSSASGSNYHSRDSRISIIKADGTIGTTNKAVTATDWSTTLGYYSYGANNDLWGETWTAENINDVDFGVVLSAALWNFNTCLNENSLISTPNGLVKIKDLKTGDSILSYNETTKKVEQSIISNVWSSPIANANNRYFYIHSNGKTIKATENHKFYVSGSYIRADELKIGDKLLDIEGNEYSIDSIEIVENTIDNVWDLTVENNHNFFAESFLVHNSPTASVDHIRITVYYTTP